MKNYNKIQRIISLILLFFFSVFVLSTLALLFTSYSGSIGIIAGFIAVGLSLLKLILMWIYE